MSRKPVIRFKLGEILRQRKISQRKASELTGVSKNGISILVRSPAGVHFDTLGKLCAGLGLGPADFFSLEKK